MVKAIAPIAPLLLMCRAGVIIGPILASLFMTALDADHPEKLDERNQ